VVGWYHLIFCIHLVSFCTIFSGSWRSLFLRLVGVIGIPLVILSLMLEYTSVMIVVIVF
jgi:hypothetical protein